MPIKKADFSRVNPGMMLAATRKLVDINKGSADPDDRDSLTNQTLLGPEDFFSERINKDSGGIGQKILWKSTGAGKLVGANNGALSPQLESILIGSGLASAMEEINPLEIHDQHMRITRMGQGGIPSEQSISEEAKAVQPSQFGYIDALRGPESARLGVDTRATIGSYKGDDGNIYSNFVDVRTGKINKVSAKEAATKVLAFPGELKKPGNTVRALVRGKLGYVNKKEVDYELPHASEMFGTLTNMVPMPNTIQGNRLFMAGKMIPQALPLAVTEAPLVQSALSDGGVSYVEALGEKVGAIRAKQGGRVISATDDTIKVKHEDGTVKSYDLYNNFPLNRKTQLHNTRQVKAGDIINKGQLLASSNFTDDKGVAAIGKNLRVGFMPYKDAFEDAYIMSESGAKKMSSQHMYTKELDSEDGVNTKVSKFISMFPSTFNKDQLSKIDENGRIKEGSKVQKGDPLILATGTINPKAEGQWTSISGKVASKFRDRSQVWDHDAEGIVTDVMETPQGIKVAVKSIMPFQPADKLSGLYGDKGVVARIVPDEQMPKDEQGRPFDIIQNPLTLPTRMNPSQIYEMLLAKIARKTGKPYKIEQFKEEDMADFVERELKKHGLKDTETVFDPADNRELKNILTGEKYFMKLHHTAESKTGARGTAAYTADDTPASGGKEGSKTIANLGLNALLAHGANSFIRDSKLFRGQRNDDFWRSYKLGLKPKAQQESTIYRKYLAHLQGAGVKVSQQPNQINIMAMTDKDIDNISSGAITSADTVDSKDLSPLKGGLFDRAITGAHGGRRYAHINLSEPLPNPVMEEPIRRLLGITKKDVTDIIAKRKDINGLTGGSGLKEALRRLPVKKLITAAEEDIKTSKGAKRDDSIKRLRYLKMMEKTGIKPEDLVISKFLVIPPMYRPITKLDNKIQLAADANYLYQDLMLHNEVLDDVRKEFGDDEAGDEKVNLYKSMQAVAGLADPVPQKLKDQKVQGLLKHVFGKGSPKFGNYQRRVIGMQTDLAARSAITPNSDLDMDEVGLPEEQAWKIYEPFVIRKMVQRGVKATDASKMLESRDKQAKDALESVIKERPIIITRAPALGKYNMVAVKPKLIKGNSLQTSPIIMGSLVGDFDGDTMSYHVPVSDEAVNDALTKMLPSKNLLHAKDFDAHYIPTQEYAYGLYQASSPKKSGKSHVFRSKEDAIKAYRRGEIGINDEVTIHK